MAASPDLKSPKHSVLHMSMTPAGADLLTASDLLSHLRAEGIQLSAQGERLLVNAARGQLSDELRAQIGKHKHELLALLAQDAGTGSSGAAAGHAERPGGTATKNETGPAGASATSDAPATPVAPGDYPLSSAQRRLWFIDRLEAGSTAYNLVASHLLDEAIDEDAMAKAVNDVVERQASLRTVFPDVDGEPLQRVLPFSPVRLEVVDLRSLAASEPLARARDLMRADAAQPFDLAAGPPFRARLLRLDDARYALVFSMHHIVSDGWSLAIFLQDLRACYDVRAAGRRPALPPLQLQYVDFARHEQQRLDEATVQRLLDHWRQRLADAPAVLGLPTDRPRPPQRTFSSDFVTFSLPGSLDGALKRLARGEGATVYMVLLSVFNVLLWRYSQQSDIVVGTPLANRPRPELEQLIGMFATTLPIRTKLDDELSGRQLIATVRNAMLDAQEHSDLPFERLVDELAPQRSLAWSPVFQVVFVLQNTPRSAQLQVTSGGAMYDLSFFIWDDAGLHATLEYNTDLLDRATVERMGAHFVQLAEGLVLDPDKPVSRLPILSPRERRQLLVEWNDTDRPYPRDTDLATLFDAAAQAHADAVAVETDDPEHEVLPMPRLTYAALAEGCGRVAAGLRAHGVAHGQAVAVCLERSIGAVASIVAVVKSGAAYVPLDPGDPPGRMADVLRDAGVQVMLSRRKLAPRLAKLGVTVLNLEDLWAARDVPALRSTPIPAESLAYVMFTSGTTGRPKGVCVTHRNVARLVCNPDYVELGADETLLQFAPLAFDASTLEIWGALLHGARLVVYPDNVPTAAQLGQALEQHRISILWLTSGFFHQMVENAVKPLATVRQVLTGGDIVSAAHVRSLLAAKSGGVVVNGYGPTENTTFTCCHRMTSANPPADSVPIGRPIANTRVYILDAHGEPVPIGVAGELFAGGDGVARGYLGDADGSAAPGARFLPDPFSERPGATMYRTGDLARWRADGSVDFLGRRDRQVKVRGFRIELEEIENCLRGHASLRDAAVIARRDAAGVNSLAAYVVPAAPGAFDEAALKRHLSDHLPAHMLPAAFVALPALPLTANGKLDRNALPDPQEGAAVEGAVEPRTLVEAQLHAIWQRVLGRSGFGIRDNFFELGGHSLLAVRLFAQIERAFGIKLPISALFLAPDIEQLAQRLEQEGFSSPWSSLVPIRTDGAAPPLFLVPGVGGNVICYQELAHCLGGAQPLYGLQSRGLDGREPPFERIEPMAESYLREIRQVQPHGPYRLGGSCFGGVVAFEMAQQLVAAGEQVDLLFLLETWPPIRRRPVRDALRLHSHQLRFIVSSMRRHLAELVRTPWRELGPALKTRLRIVREIAEQRDLYRGDRATMYLDRVSMANLAALFRYEPRPYPGAILFARASERRFQGPDLRDVWRQLAEGGYAEIDIATDDSGHMLMAPHAQALGQWMVEALRSTTPAGAGVVGAATVGTPIVRQAKAQAT